MVNSNQSMGLLSPWEACFLNSTSSYFFASQIIHSGKRSLIMREVSVRPTDVLDTDRIIEMAWEDRTPFDAIRVQFGLSQGEVEKLMRRELKPSSFRRWRKRVSSGVGVKHRSKADPEMLRFKCTRQRAISSNRISKR